MKIKQIIVLLIMVFAILLSGCVEEKEQVILAKANDTSINPVINPNAHKTELKEVIEEQFWFYKRTTAVVTGKIVEIRFRNSGPDILVFEDGTVVSTYDAENFVFQIGKIHTIKIGSTSNGKFIKEVSISPEDP